MLIDTARPATRAIFPFSIMITLGLGIFLLAGCLGQRLTAEQVVQNAQASLADLKACHTALQIEIDTDMIKDLLSVQVWEELPDRFKVQIESATNPQFQGLAFTTDGVMSIFYSPHTNTATVGPADMVLMPQVIEKLIRVRQEWIQNADPQKAKLLARVRQDGLIVYKVDIPTDQGGKAQYSIDAHQWWVRQVAFTDEYLGTGVIRLQSMECFDDLDDALFNLDIPDGAVLEEVKMEESRPLTLAEAQVAVGFRLRLPEYLPPDTRLEVAYQLDKNMALVYVGENAFTLVQGPSIGPIPQENVTLVSVRGRQATLVQDEELGGVLLTWREDELQFSIAGSLDLNELFQIAESLR